MKQRFAVDQSLVTAVLAITIARLTGAPQPMEPVSFSVTHVEDAHPKFIHIYNLEDGPRAIVMPSVHAEDSDPSRPIRIFNASAEGVQEIAQPPK
jgi:hypothetical protein